MAPSDKMETFLNEEKGRMTRNREKTGGTPTFFRGNSHPDFFKRLLLQGLFYF
jgi:hypothetical protein